MIRVLIMVFFCSFLALNSAFAENKTPKTVLDYFQRLPERYFEVPEVRTEWLKHKSTVVDIANGYLFLQGDGAQSSLFVCIFKKSDQQRIIAVHDESPDSNTLSFYTYHAGQWQDITSQVLPKDIDAAFLAVNADGAEDTNFAHNIKMPRHGTTIVIENAEHKKTHELVWQKDTGTFQLNALKP